MELDGAERWAPSGELVHPVGQGGFGNNDEVGALNIQELELVGEDGDGLEGFPETHLIGEDTVEALLH